MKYDYLIVGAGLFGAVLAQQLTVANKKVLVIERRNHIAGNIYTEDINGIAVHKYGAHIFHTNDKTAWDYVNRFAEFNRYTNSPIANYKGEIYSLPFNMYTFNKMWGVITPQEAADYIQKEKNDSKIQNPENLEEQAISLVGKQIYEKLIKGYTEKQWGRDCKELPAFIIKRLPLRFSYDNNYFNALYQGIPVSGYTDMIKRMLEKTTVLCNTDFFDDKEKYIDIADKVIFTGTIDSYYNYCYGHLQYRTVKFETEQKKCDNYQGNSVVNYTDRETPWTRIIEHKWFNFGKDKNGNAVHGTIISKEYSTEWTPGEEPYYPINDEKNTELYKKYKALSDNEDKIIFGGRLGEYKYYDMDTTVISALKLAERLINQ